VLTFAPGRQGQSGSGSASVGGAFNLVDQTGKPFTEKDLRGKPSLVFFGFTHCPDICPTKLFEITELLDALGPMRRR
jgi:protein SCO1/2